MVSPTSTPSRRAKSRPITTAPSASENSPAVMLCGMRLTWASRSGSTPRISGVSTCPLGFWINIKLCRNGAAAVTPGTASNCSQRLSSSSPRPPATETVMCALKSRILSRHISSKPVITESTITSTATPSSTPSVASTVTTDRKVRFGLRYFSARNNENGNVMRGASRPVAARESSFGGTASHRARFPRR